MEIPFFTYQGSKASIRKWILPFMPTEGNTYLEPFAGRGNMFFLARKSLNFKHWIVNDIQSAPFLAALMQDPTWFPETMTWELFKEFKNWWEADRNHVKALMIEPGIAHLGHYRSGWMGKYLHTRKWNRDGYIERVKSAGTLLSDATISNVDWETTVCQVGADDFIYLDPPYLDTEHRYYNDIDHVHFLEVLKKLPCRWLLSHTAHPLYLEALGEPVARRNRKAGGKACGGKVAILEECLWKGNY